MLEEVEDSQPDNGSQEEEDEPTLLEEVEAIFSRKRKPDREEKEKIGKSREHVLEKKKKTAKPRKKRQPEDYLSPEAVPQNGTNAYESYNQYWVLNQTRPSDLIQEGKLGRDLLC